MTTKTHNGEFKYWGYGVDRMNYLAKVGVCTKDDLQQWADMQNDYIVSIRWQVKTYTKPVDTSYTRYVEVPELYYTIEHLE